MTTLVKKIITFCYVSELMRVILLIAMTLYVYRSYFSASNMGDSDAHYYLDLLQDANIQLGKGFFPTYLGQSLFSPYGAPSISAPYYLLLGQLLNTFSFGLASPLVIQHLTILISAVSSVLIIYYLIKNLAPALNWSAFFLAFAYITSPGLISLIFHLDMYFSFMATPFVPIVFYGLARIYLKADALAYVLTGSALALVWMAHPPIALWTSIFSFIFCLAILIITRKSLIKFSGLALLFILLCIWQFYPILSLGLRSDYTGFDSVDAIIAELSRSIPDAFLPLGQGKSQFYFLQLGYSLWFGIGLAGIIAFQSPGRLLIRLMLALIVIILLFLYPLPVIGNFLWSSLPALVLDLTQLWPDLRLYIIFSSISALVGALALQVIYKSEFYRLKIIVNVFLVVLFLWNIHQVNHIVSHSDVVKLSNEAGASQKNSWVSSKNLYENRFKLPVTFAVSLFRGMQDPQLKSRLLDEKKNSIDDSDNEQSLIKKCLNRRAFNLVNNNQKISFPLESVLKEPISIAHVKLLPNSHYLICLDMSTANGDSIFQLLDHKRREVASLTIPSPADADPRRHFKATKEAPIDSPIRRLVGIPVYITDSENQGEGDNAVYDFRVWSSQQPRFNLVNANIIDYDPSLLPIVIESYTPYKATAIVKTEHKYLEVTKLFKPGYVAFVNGEESSVIESADKTIIIPLKNGGLNKIELRYVGTWGIRGSFYISAISWCLVFVFLISKWISSRRPKLKR